MKRILCAVATLAMVLDADGIVRKKFVGAITYETLLAAIEDCR